MSQTIHCYHTAEKIVELIPATSSKEEIINAFSSGKLPFGMIWRALDEELRNLSGECQEMERIVLQSDAIAKEIDDEILQKKKQMEELQQQLAQLEEKKKRKDEAVKDIKLKLVDLKAYMNGEYKEKKEIVEVSAEVEADFMQKMENQLFKPSSFSCTFDGDNLPLSSYLSLMGLNSSEIQALEGVNGEEFLFAGENALSSLSTIETKKKVAYAFFFLKDKLFLSNHAECAVCECGSAEELGYLLAEHKMKIENDNLLMHKKLNGQQSLYVNRHDVTEVEKELSCKLSHANTMNTVQYLRKIHLQALSSNLDPSMNCWGDNGEIKQLVSSAVQLMSNRRIISYSCPTTHNVPCANVGVPQRFVFEWGIHNGVAVDGKAFRGLDSCSTSRFARSSIPMKRNTFIILKCDHLSCYGAVGLATIQFNGTTTRLGMDKNSWGMRNFHSNNAPEFSGAHHNGKHQKTPLITTIKEVKLTFTPNGELQFHSTDSNNLLFSFENLPKDKDLYLYGFVCGTETMEFC